MISVTYVKKAAPVDPYREEEAKELMKPTETNYAGDREADRREASRIATRRVELKDIAERQEMKAMKASLN